MANYATLVRPSAQLPRPPYSDRGANGDIPDVSKLLRIVEGVAQLPNGGSLDGAIDPNWGVSLSVAFRRR